MKGLRNLALFVVVFGALFASPAFGQGCAMCKANAAAAPAESQRALKRGILTLLLPSLAMVGVLGGLVYRHRE
jgi:hypothetical protein